MKSIITFLLQITAEVTLSSETNLTKSPSFAISNAPLKDLDWIPFTSATPPSATTELFLEASWILSSVKTELTSFSLPLTFTVTSSEALEYFATVAPLFSVIVTSLDATFKLITFAVLSATKLPLATRT